MMQHGRSVHFNEIVRRSLDTSNPNGSAEFRARLLSDPEGLIRDEGFEISETELGMLKTLTTEAVGRTARFVTSAVDEDPTTA